MAILPERRAAPSGFGSRLAYRTPAVLAAVLAVGLAAVGYLLRQRLVEPEVMGALCTSADPAFWCPVRTAVIAASQWGVLGWASVALAVAALILPARLARPVALSAAVLAGLGLALYNAGIAVPALALALLRLVRLEQEAP